MHDEHGGSQLQREGGRVWGVDETTRYAVARTASDSFGCVYFLRLLDLASLTRGIAFDL